MAQDEKQGEWIDGIWALPVWVRKRWVSKTSRKRFAYPTKDEAMVNYKARKRCQVKILKARLTGALERLNVIDNEACNRLQKEISYGQSIE